MTVKNTTRCILLTSSQQSSELHARLKANGWEVSEFADPAMALAEAALCERAQAARSAWGLERADSAVLTIDEPAQWTAVPCMLRAVARYMPKLQVWQWVDGELRSLTAPSPDTPIPSPPASSTSGDEEREKVDHREGTITRDELDMLLQMGDAES